MPWGGGRGGTIRVYGTLAGREVAVADEQGFALHHNFHLCQIVAHKGTAAAYYVEYGVAQTNARTYLYRTGDYMYVGVYMVFVQETAQDIRV